MLNSWLPFFRDTMYEPVFKDPYIFKVWMWILSKASIKQRMLMVNNTVVELQPGEALIESRSMAAEFLDLSEGKYRRILDNLVKLGYITKKTTNKYTIVNVIKWEKYSVVKEKSVHQSANKYPTKNNQTNIKQTSDNQDKARLYINNNYNNLNNYNNYNNSNNSNNTVPTPKSTKFRNFEPSPDATVDKEWEKENLKRVMNI